MPEKRTTVFLFILITFLAGIFRLSRIDLMEYKADEAINVFLATRARFGHAVPPGGTVSSVGILNPPLFNYLLTPISFFSTDPQIFALSIALVNTLAVGAFFLLVSRYFQRVTALFSSVFLALAFWPILYSRKIWTQDLVFPATVLMLFSFCRATIDGQKRYWVLFGIAIALLSQLHQANILLLPICIGFFLLNRRKIPIRPLILGLVMGFLSLVPYLFFLFTKHCIGCYSYRASSHPVDLSLFLHFLLPFAIAGLNGLYSIFGTDYTQYVTEYFAVGKTKGIDLLIIIATLFGLVICWKKYKDFRFLPFLFVVLPLSFFFLRFDTFQHYYLLLLPIVFLFLGISFATFYTSRHLSLRIISIVLFIVIAGSYIFVDISFFDFLAKQKQLHGDYGNTYLISKEVSLKRLSGLDTDEYYPEMFIASFVPLQSISGPDTIASSVYSLRDVESRLPEYDLRLTIVPVDPRMHLLLTAFYTQNPVTWDTLILVYRKSQKIVGYQPIFARLLDTYADENSLRKQSIVFPK
ncbi:MAG: glycosyltransferase family 39 protein [bacterium]|nr:glycosyltransferase family 39 protein [bacterium]